MEKYAPLLGACRESMLRRLAEAPFALHLAPYFQRGKMLRALSTFLSAAAVGGDPARVANAAEAVELLHGASLIHDDIIDGADTRRGLPALHERLGPHVALVLGDYLLLRSFRVLNEARSGHAADRVLDAVRELGSEAETCCRGQIQELTPGDPDPEREYFEIAQRKTAAQFAAALAVGAILGRGARAEIEALRSYGVATGTAFQIRDDVLDLVGDPRQLGKPAGNSLARARPFLPSIYALKYGSPSAASALRLFENGECDRRTLSGVIEREGILARVEEAAARYVASARHALDALPPSEAVEALRTLAEYAGFRQS